LNKDIYRIIVSTRLVRDTGTWTSKVGDIDKNPIVIDSQDKRVPVKEYVKRKLKELRLEEAKVKVALPINQPKSNETVMRHTNTTAPEQFTMVDVPTVSAAPLQFNLVDAPSFARVL